MRKRDRGFSLTDLTDLSPLTAQHAVEDELDLPGDPLNPRDFKAADDVLDDYEGLTEDPILKAKLFEGDIYNLDLRYLELVMKGQTYRNAIRDSWTKWPGGDVPYVLSRSFNSRERSVIAKAMMEFHQETCIRFVPRTSEQGYINIMKGSGCYSSVGKTGSKQEVS